MTLHHTVSEEKPIFTEDLRARVAAVLRHVQIDDEGVVVYDDARKWVALVYIGLDRDHRSKPVELVMTDEIGPLGISVAAGAVAALKTISTVERHELTGEALLGRWPFPR